MTLTWMHVAVPAFMAIFGALLAGPYDSQSYTANQMWGGLFLGFAIGWTCMLFGVWL